MATPSLEVKQPAPRGIVAVVIELDPEGENIVVTPDPFWVSKSAKEEVKWFCSIGHIHGDADHPCFKLDFDPVKGSPFDGPLHFEGHHKATGLVRDSVEPCPIGKPSYKYSVWVDTPTGHLTKDPTGGVEP
ncbi:MAG TPA: hypothetical protein VFI95_15220 [Terriglobales bacterium]|nr:hypothetical protein [Terriglobales bacterium]